MKTAYAITVGEYVEDIVLGDYDDAEWVAKANHWDGVEPEGDGDLFTKDGYRIGIHRAELHQPVGEPGSLKDQLEKFLMFGGAFDELKSAVDRGDESATIYWMGQMQCDVAVMVTNLMMNTAHKMRSK
jgi:hypothetical protein